MGITACAIQSKQSNRAGTRGGSCLPPVGHLLKLAHPTELLLWTQPCFAARPATECLASAVHASQPGGGCRAHPRTPTLTTAPQAGTARAYPGCSKPASARLLVHAGASLQLLAPRHLPRRRRSCDFRLLAALSAGPAPTSRPPAGSHSLSMAESQKQEAAPGMLTRLAAAIGAGWQQRCSNCCHMPCGRQGVPLPAAGASSVCTHPYNLHAAGEAAIGDKMAAMGLTRGAPTEAASLA